MNLDDYAWKLNITTKMKNLTIHQIINNLKYGYFLAKQHPLNNIEHWF